MERVKLKGHELSKREKFILEVGIPTFSVCALLGITGYITSEAVGVIMDGGEDDDLSIVILYSFASVNMVIDIVSFLMFYYRRKTVFSDNKIEEEEIRRSTNLNMISAFTHVGGDTLRTISLFLVAIIATFSSVPGR